MVHDLAGAVEADDVVGDTRSYPRKKLVLVAQHAHPGHPPAVVVLSRGQNAQKCAFPARTVPQQQSAHVQFDPIARAFAHHHLCNLALDAPLHLQNYNVGLNSLGHLAERFQGFEHIVFNQTQGVAIVLHAYLLNCLAVALQQAKSHLGGEVLHSFCGGLHQF